MEVVTVHAAVGSSLRLCCMIIDVPAATAAADTKMTDEPREQLRYGAGYSTCRRMPAGTEPAGQPTALLLSLFWRIGGLLGTTCNGMSCSPAKLLPRTVTGDWPLRQFVMLDGPTMRLGNPPMPCSPAQVKGEQGSMPCFGRLERKRRWCIQKSEKNRLLSRLIHCLYVFAHGELKSEVETNLLFRLPATLRQRRQVEVAVKRLFIRIKLKN
jgi:hypothetical protein